MILRTVVPEKKKDLSPGKEGKTGKGMSATSQAIATCITFSFVYRNRHPNLALIPTILTCSEGFVMFLYDSEGDVLLKCGLPWKQKFLIVLSAVLNYKLFLNSAKVNLDIKFGYHNKVITSGRHTLKNVTPYDKNYMVAHIQGPTSAFQFF